MRCSSTAGIPALMAALAALGAAPALAAGRVCSPLTIEADSAVTERWPELAERVREAFVTRDDIDACAQVALTSADAAISVLVTLPDGRSASRAAPRPEDVVPILEALLIVPSAESQVPLAPPPEPDSAPAAQDEQASLSRTTPADSLRNATLQPGAASPTHLSIELSIASEARAGDGATSLGLGALAFVDISEWLVGFEGRVDRYRYEDGSPSGSALELAALAGRRVPFGSFALDLVAGPAVALGGSSTVVLARSAPAADGEAEGMFEKSLTEDRAAVPRLLLKAHLGFGARSVVRGFVGVNGELGPRGVPAAQELGDGAQRLPSWTIGIALGATVGTT
jgi:hypothetical protein